MVIQKIAEQQTDLIRNGLENTIRTTYCITENLAKNKNATKRVHIASSTFTTGFEQRLTLFKAGYNSITIFCCHFLHL